jgi:N-acyl-D-amino-acid deacylase
VNQKHIMSLPQGIERSSSRSAKMLGFKKRGVLAPGYFADVIVFDNNTFADRSTYEQPTLLATGMKYVLVNGALTIDNGKYTGVTAGRVLKR